MNSHVFQKIGVAYTAKYIVQIFLFSVVFIEYISSTYSAPLSPSFNDFSFSHNKNNSDVMVPPERVNTDTYSFLHANNNMWLEILKDGTVKTNTCPTKFGALESGSHSTMIGKMGLNQNDAGKIASEAAIYFKGVIAEKFLCVRRSGEIYTSKDYDDVDCAFEQIPKFENVGNNYHYFKHLYHNNTYSTRASLKKNKNRKAQYRKKTKTVRFQLGFNTNGSVFIVQRHTQRRDLHKPMLSINRVPKEMPLNEKCRDKNIKKPKLRFKFCRRVWKNYFRSSVKDIRRFRKYDCWNKLRKDRRRKLRNQQKRRGDIG